MLLPGLDGIGLCRRVRETSLVPILMMSARGEGLDVIAGLEAGADDYVVKPVETSVLVARIRSLLRRATYAPGPARTTGEEPPASEETGTGCSSGTSPSTPAAWRCSSPDVRWRSPRPN